MERFKAIECRTWKTNYRIYIPIWRDLKAAVFSAAIFSAFDLHSNMERFKGSRIIFIISSSDIYIPIWRDLKCDACAS